MRKVLTTAAMAGLAISSPAMVKAATSTTRPGQCFQSGDWQGWRAADANTMYIKVRGRSIYRLDMAQSCSAMLAPDAHLITYVHGPSEICEPVDIDLKVSEGDGFATPCIVSKITPLTPAEAAALPKKFRP